MRETRRVSECLPLSGHLPGAQYSVEGRNYVLFEFAANSGNYIRRAIAVVTIANGATSLAKLSPKPCSGYQM